MDVDAVFGELFRRLLDLVHRAVDGLDATALHATVLPGTNSIGWLVWHLTRTADDHTAGLLDEPQLWESGDWAERFGLAADPGDTGYGHTPAQVAAVRPSGPNVLIDYFEAVATRIDALVAGLSPTDLDRVVDVGWDPPVTQGVRLVSIASDCLQHAGQAAYLRGLLGHT